jgi:hypothetical protein
MPAEVVVVLQDATLASNTAEALQALGRNAVAIQDPMAALSTLEAARRIDLLVTSGDFAPGKPNGLALARMTRMKRPDLQVVFVGPTTLADIVTSTGAFIPTPTTASEIAIIVEQMIHAGPAAG